MSLTAKLFSFEGRISRGDWWILSIGVCVVMPLLYWAAFVMLLGGAGLLVGADKKLGSSALSWTARLAQTGSGRRPRASAARRKPSPD